MLIERIQKKRRLARLVGCLAAMMMLTIFPLTAASLESLEARWSWSEDGLGDVQFEFKKGSYLARALVDDESCGVELCDVVFRGVLDSDGILVGEGRACEGEGRWRPVWKFVMGRLSDDNNALELVGTPWWWIEKKSGGAQGNSRIFQIHRKNLDRVDCEKRLRIQKVVAQIHEGMGEEERRAVTLAIQGLKNRYPDAIGQLLLAQGRLEGASGSQSDVEKARESFEIAVKKYGVSWGHCELAILSATHPKKFSAGESSRQFRRCLANNSVSCQVLDSPRMVVLRGLKEFWDHWQRRKCDSSANGH